MADSCVLDDTLYSHYCLLELMKLRLQINRHLWSLEVLRNIYHFFQSRYTKCHIFRWDSCKMESVQSHLSCWFSKWMRCNWTHHFSRTYQTLFESWFDLSHQPIKGWLVESLLLNNLFGVQLLSEIYFHHHQCIFIEFFAHLIHIILNLWMLDVFNLATWENCQVLKKFLYTIYYILRT